MTRYAPGNPARKNRTARIKKAKKYIVPSSLQISSDSNTAKYLQIADLFFQELNRGNISVGDSIPSINELSIKLDIARDTVERGYKYLKSIGVIDAVPRRGYYIRSADFRRINRVFLLFNNLSLHKKLIYDSFVETLGDYAALDFFIYDNNINLFKKILLNRKNDYTHYVIIPHFQSSAEEKEACEFIKDLPEDKLILLDKRVDIPSNHCAVFENFETDIYLALKDLLFYLNKYNKINIIFPIGSYYPKDILTGFKKFCLEWNLNFEIINDIKDVHLKKGELYIPVADDDLLLLIENIQAIGLTVGSDIGIISYNETPIKKLLLNGITTISTDFKQMGKLAAELILSHVQSVIHVPFKVTVRPSL